MSVRRRTSCLFLVDECFTVFDTLYIPGNRYMIVFPAVLCMFVEPNLALFPVFKMSSPSWLEEIKKENEGSKHTGSTLM